MLYRSALVWKALRLKSAEERGKAATGGRSGHEGTKHTQCENGLSGGQPPSLVTTLHREGLPDPLVCLKQACKERTSGRLPKRRSRDHAPWGRTASPESMAMPRRQRGEYGYLSVSSSISGSSKWAPHGRSFLSSAWSCLASSGGGVDMFRAEPSWGQKGHSVQGREPGSARAQP